jgi:regulator of PEP synthase PpsR (kinase-PPPase family)
MAKRIAPKSTDVRRTLHVLSDATGNLAQHMLAALLTQFPPDLLQIHIWTFQRTPDQIDQTLSRIDARNDAVLHALVSAEAKARVNAFCAEKGVPCRDLTGPLSQFVQDITRSQPTADAAKLHAVDQTYHRRIASMEFTLDHDDGLGLETLNEADIVLTGVSRTSKTPTSILLAQYGYKCANVSLAVEVDPPRALLLMPAQKVVGLTIDPHQLAAIRTRRSVDWKMGQTDYNDIDHVKHELTWCRRLFSRSGWRTLDVTHSAVEETAARVLDLLGLPRLGTAR